MTPPPPVESLVRLLTHLVRIPSRAGEDAPGPVLDATREWLQSQGVAVRGLESTGQPAGLYAEAGTGDGPWFVLNAMLDTAGFGDAQAWAFGPTSAEVHDGWLYGRGAGDAKAAVAIFAHLFAEFSRTPSALGHGRLGVLFDVDEHSGGFSGARAFFGGLADRRLPLPRGVMIGYPGLDAVVTGGRGFLRATITVVGEAAHSGSSRRRGRNAITRLLALADILAGLPLPPAETGFGLPPTLTITGIRGGGAFSEVPGLASLDIDVRLTPNFGDGAARQLIQQAIARHDAEDGGAATRIEWRPGWPAFRIDDTQPMVQALQSAARDELGAAPPTKVAGPSNIGNYLSTLGVPAICGFGVRADHLHGADERVALDTLAPVYRIYRRALTRLFTP